MNFHIVDVASIFFEIKILIFKGTNATQYGKIFQRVFFVSNFIFGHN